MINEGERDRLASLIVEAAWRLRSEGARISTAEIVKAVELAEAYMSLLGKRELSRDELELLLCSSFTMFQGDCNTLKDALALIEGGRRLKERAASILSDIERDLETIGGKPRARITKKKATRAKSKAEKAEKIAAFYRLKRAGVIRGTPGRERIVDSSQIRRIALELARSGASSLDEAVRNMEMPREWDGVLDAVEAGYHPGELAEASEKRLLKLARAAERKHDRGLLESVAEELARRLRCGYRVRDPHAVASILEKAGVMTDTLRRILALEAPMASQLSPDNLVKALEASDYEKGGRLLASALEKMSRDEALRVISRVDPRYLWNLSKRTMRKLDDKSVVAAYYASNAIRESLRYFETSDESRGDLASDYLEKARSMSENISSSIIDKPVLAGLIEEASVYLRLAESLGGNLDPGLLEGELRKIGYIEGIRFLRNAYRVAGEELRRVILSSMERLLYRLSSREGLRLLPVKRRSRVPPGRVDVRRSLYSIMRVEPQPITYLRKLKSARLSLALDMSGSMFEYSSWAIGVASLFSNNLERLILFSHDVSVYREPITRRMLARILLEYEFEGYTNISKALREAGASTRSRRVVVVSDLKQTVEDEPVPAVVESLRKLGKKIVFIVPSKHDEQARMDVERAGGIVVPVRDPQRMAGVILRVLLRG
ncbi:MAG: VWA domain-containing protein [Desulfurococcales archaeon]|nr:VWA domain-containing protein [Desulfurococcales archaeon]